VYMAWFDILVAGLKGLQHFNVEQRKWTQAHVQAAYVIMQVLIEGGKDLVKFESCTKDDKPYIVVHLDRSQIATTGKAALTAFLHKLHIYKVNVQPSARPSATSRALRRCLSTIQLSMPRC
jgi:dipeptidyl-peptidase-3